MLLNFYGDDFTGSTDAMEVLEWGGVRTMLFLEPPTPEFLAENFPDIEAVGVAGASRSMTPAEMDDALPPTFAALRALGAPALHYKVCSTFDSSPQIGSIGHALDLGVAALGAQIVPVIVGAPSLRRYVAFSNLFARAEDAIYRIDRHPTMSKHPATPMTEGDLRLHLGKQTGRQIAPIDLLQLAAPAEEVSQAVDDLRRAGVEVVVFDTTTDDHLKTIGGVLNTLIAGRTGGSPQFVVGSSGVEQALIRDWQAQGIVRQPEAPPTLAAVDQVLVMSGSAAPGSAAQIKWAQAHGYATIRLNAAELVDTETANAEREAAVAAALDQLARGQSVVLFSTLGPDDPTIAVTKDRLTELGIDPRRVSRILGKQQGLILRDLLERSPIRRVVVAGGDTCSYAVQQLGIFALRAAALIAPGAPLCRAYSSISGLDGLEIALKGGQIGQPEYYEQIRRGCP